MNPIQTVFSLTLALAGTPRAFAQSPAPVPSTTSPTTGTVLFALRFDQKEGGTLILVGESEEGSKPLAGQTPAQCAAAINRRAVTVGTITTLVPDTIPLINVRPGKPDPLAGIPSETRLRVLLAQWTPEQWTKAGSDAGSGIPWSDFGKVRAALKRLPAAP